MNSFELRKIPNNCLQAKSISLCNLLLEMEKEVPICVQCTSILILTAITLWIKLILNKYIFHNKSWTRRLTFYIKFICKVKHRTNVTQFWKQKLFHCMVNSITTSSTWYVCIFLLVIQYYIVQSIDSQEQINVGLQWT